MSTKQDQPDVIIGLAPPRGESPEVQAARLLKTLPPEVVAALVVASSIDRLSRALDMNIRGPMLDPESWSLVGALKEHTSAIEGALGRIVGDDRTKDPSGLEGLAIAIAGDQLKQPLSEAVGRVADALENSK